METHVAHAHYVDLCKYLIDKQADPNIKNLMGKTALHVAVEERTNCAVVFQAQLDTIIKYFMEFGSGDIYIKDNDGKTAVNYATPQHQEKLQGIPKPKISGSTCFYTCWENRIFNSTT